MGRYSVDLIARRFSKGQPAPSNNAESVQPQRRGSNVPLIHFSQSIIREFEKEDVPNNIISDTIPVPQKAVPISDKVGDSLQIDDPESKKDLEDLGVAPPNRGAQRRWAYKNVVGVSLSFFFIYSSFNSLQNLQSSINSDGGLGLASLSLIYAVFTLAGFIAPTVLKVIGTKYSLLIAFLCHLCYTLANFYPSWDTLVPVSILLGAASALVWAAGSCHLVHIAVMVAPTLDTGQDHLISIYNGLFFFVFQFSQIPGNLASSLILFPYGDGHYNSSVESNYSDTGICKHHTAAGDEFDVNLLYILVFVYLLLVVSGTMFLLVMVNHLGTEAKFMSNTNKWKVFFRDPLTELISVMKDYKMILIAPISIFNGMELSFAFGTFSEVSLKRLLHSCVHEFFPCRPSFPDALGLIK